MSITTNNGVCKKNNAGGRDHDFRDSTDGEGRIVRSCYKCGTMIVNPQPVTVRA